MSNTVQLNEMIPVETPLGFGYALILETCEHDNYWTVVLSNGALVTYPQDRIKVSRSYTHGRGITDDEMEKIVYKDEPPL